MKPDQILNIQDIIKIIEPFASPMDIIPSNNYLGVTHTGFCNSNIPHTITLAANLKWAKIALESTFVSCILLNSEVANLIKQKNIPIDKPLLIYESPQESYYFLHNQAIHKLTYRKYFQKSNTFVSSSAKIHETAIIEENVFIEDDVEIGAYAIIKSGTFIGKGTSIYDQCILGGEGLFSKKIGSRKKHLKHFGTIRVGQYCVIHEGANILRAVNFGSHTLLEDEVDCGVCSNVGHGVTVRQGTTLSSHVILAGRAEIGKNCWIGAGAMISNGLKIGDNSQVRLGSVVIKDLPNDSDVSGNFARPHHQNLRQSLKKV